VGHIGDSRCYIVQRGAIKQLTKDHSWVAEEVEAGLLTEEQARVHPRRNIITRALGLRPEVDVDVYDTDLEPGNLVVVCSDGLHGLVTEDRKSTRLNSSHLGISYAVFCLKKKKNKLIN